MKGITILALVLFFISCTQEPSLEEMIVGEWYHLDFPGECKTVIFTGSQKNTLEALEDETCNYNDYRSRAYQFTALQKIYFPGTGEEFDIWLDGDTLKIGNNYLSQGERYLRPE